MRILLVNPYALPHLGGVETAIENLAVGLTQRGHEATILSSACGEGEPAAREVGRLRVPAWNGLERSLGVPFPFFGLGLQRELRAAVARCDVVHIHGFLSQTSFVASIEARRAGKPVVLTEHVGFVPYPNPLLNVVQKTALAALGRWHLRRASGVICLNHRVEDWLRTRMTEPDRLRLIPNGIDTEAFRPPTRQEKSEARARFKIRPDRPLVLFVGRPAPKKHLERLLSGRHPSFDLLLCGPDLPCVSDSGGAIHTIRAEPSQMPAVYWAADVFVLPSEGEGFPMSVMEAMASGLPVVVCRDRAYESQVNDSEVVQTEHNARSVRDAILAILADPARSESLGRFARRKALHNFAREGSVDRHISLYEEAIASRPGVGQPTL